MQKILSARGIASRRVAEELIRAGRVSVDGTPAILGKRADPFTQEICVDGKPIPAPQGGRVYIMLNKPPGYVTTLRDDRGRRTVMDILGEHGAGLWPVGRLDYQSQGLLLLTNDGAVTQRLTHPSFEVEKIYQVRVRGREVEERTAQMEGPLIIDGAPIQPASARVLRVEPSGTAVIEVRIREGKNRQVRKMCAAVHLEVEQLTRVGEGALKLGDLKTGKWRHLTEEEIAYLQKL